MYPILFGCVAVVVILTNPYLAYSNTDLTIVDLCNGSAAIEQVEICIRKGDPFELSCNLPSDLVVMNFTKKTITMIVNSSPNSVSLPHGTMTYSVEDLGNACTAGKVVINTTDYLDISSPFFCQDGPYPSNVQVPIFIEVVPDRFNLTVEKECDRVHLSWSIPKSHVQTCTPVQFSVHRVNNVSKDKFTLITKENSITTDRLLPGVYNFFVVAEMENSKTVKSINTETVEINSLTNSTLMTYITVQPFENTTSLSFTAKWEVTEPVQKVRVSIDNQTSMLLNITDPMTFETDIGAIPVTHTVTVVSSVEQTQAELQQCFSFDFDITKEMTTVTISSIKTTDNSASIQLNSPSLLLFNPVRLDPNQGVCNRGVRFNLISCSDLIPDQKYVLLVNTTVIANNGSNISFILRISFQTSTYFFPSISPSTVVTSSPSNINGGISSDAFIGITMSGVFLILTVAVVFIVVLLAFVCKCKFMKKHHGQKKDVENQSVQGEVDNSTLNPTSVKPSQIHDNSEELLNNYDNNL